MAKTINTTAIHNAVTSALRHAHAYGQCIATLREELEGVPRSEAQDVITPAVAKKHGIACSEGQRGLTFAKDHSAYEAAKRDRSRLLASIYGSTKESKQTAPAVLRFETKRVESIMDGIAGLTKAQAKEYFAKAIERAFKESQR